MQRTHSLQSSCSFLNIPHAKEAACAHPLSNEGSFMQHARENQIGSDSAHSGEASHHGIQNDLSGDMPAHAPNRNYPQETPGCEVEI